MKAVLLKAYGDVNQLHYEEVPTPEPKPDEVLVRVISTSVNPVDYKIRSGSEKERIPVQLPYILGVDVAGEIVKVGANVRTFSAGQLVMGKVKSSYAEFLTAKPDELTVIPPGLKPEQAGAFPLVTLTGAQLIEKGVQPQPGQAVLVTGAMGSVGRTAVHIAKQHGARVIAGVKGKQLEEGLSLDVYSSVAIDSETAIQSLPELDGIADTVGGDVIGKLVSKVKQGGMVASVLGEQEVAKQAGLRVFAFMAQPDPSRLQQLAADLASGALVIPVGRSLKLSEVQEAHRVAEKGSAGKIILLP